MPEAQGETICCTEPQMDALIALLQFLNAERDLPLERFTAICDVIVDKITRQGDVKCDLKKIPDICYEGQVALMLSAFMPAFTNIEGDDHNRPDLIFKVRFINSNKPTEVAIECKNIRKHYAQLHKLINAVAKAIRAAAAQHDKRKNGYHDLIVFIDLPIGTLSEATEDHFRLIVNVWASLEETGYQWIEEPQVVFTATSQQGMMQHVLTSDPKNRNLVKLRPVVRGMQSRVMKAPRGIFLSALFRDLEAGEAMNIENWSKVALGITDPDQYLIGKRRKAKLSRDAENPPK
ncbi:MAG: hypothetical protein WAO58_04875 [Fimbriimonadaceae bacterium]